MKADERYVMVDGIRTHYWEAGAGEPLVLLHSGEYGASAEFSWEFNIEALSRHFHVIALDLVGFGQTDKVFSFDNMQEFRIRHIQRFCETLCIDEAHFIGASFGGGMLLKVAAAVQPAWPIKKLVTVSGGGPMSETGLKLLRDYDCSLEGMKTILHALFERKDILTEAYIARRHEMSLLPGAWECQSAPRFAAPVRQSGGAPHMPDYTKIRVPVLICHGDKDQFKRPDYGTFLQSSIPDATLHVFHGCGHVSNIESAGEWNEAVIDFLKK